MKRTQLYFDEKIHKELYLQAKKENRTISDLVRDLVDEGLTVRKAKNPSNLLLRLAKSGFKGPKNLSKNIDKILYGS